MTDGDISVRGGTGRSASTLELFFDLVYVYAITQVVGLIHAEDSAASLLQGALILFLLWWTWSIYTWTTNWSGTSDAITRLFLLAAMAATLLMALAVPTAFGDGSRWFGVTYFVVRLLAASFYFYESKDYPAQRHAFLTFYPLSMVAAGLVLVGGFLDEPALTWLWTAGLALDAFSALNAGRGTWAVDAAHFAERNGLFIIIALGESIVGIGLTASGVDRDAVHVAAIVVAFIIAASLWWAYFDRASPYLEHHFVNATGKEPGRFARDAYTLLHYPLVVGIVFYAVAAEEVVAHPDEPLGDIGRLALTLGISLVFIAIAAATFRAVRRIAPARLVAVLAVLAVGAISETWTALTFASVIAAIVVVAIAAEHLRPLPLEGESAR